MRANVEDKSGAEHVLTFFPVTCEVSPNGISQIVNNIAKIPKLTKNAYHTIFIYEKNACHTLSYNFIEQK